MQMTVLRSALGAALLVGFVMVAGAGAQVPPQQQQRIHGLLVWVHFGEDGHGQGVAGLVGRLLVAQVVGVVLGRFLG